MRNRVQFTMTEVVPKPEPGKANIFVDREGELRSLDSDGNAKFVGQEMSDVVPVNAAFAAVTLEPAGINNDITIIADVAGVAGNDFSVVLVDPTANDATLAVTTADNLLFSVSLATGVAGAITSTANEVIAALNALPAFSTRMTAANAAANDGTAVVTALAAASLTGGVDLDDTPPYIRINGSTAYIFNKIAGLWRTITTSDL